MFKTYYLPLVCLCALVVTPALQPARAQSAPVNVTIPFDFVIDGEAAPSGKYVISRSLASGSQGLRIRSADGRVRRSVTTARTESDTPRPLRVVFNVYGERHFLSQVFWSGSMSGFQLSKCKAELVLEAAARRDKAAPQLTHTVVGK